LIRCPGAAEVGRSHKCQPVAFLIEVHDPKPGEPDIARHLAGGAVVRDIKIGGRVDDLAREAVLDRRDGNRLARVALDVEKRDRRPVRLVRPKITFLTKADMRVCVIVNRVDLVGSANARRLVGLVRECLRPRFQERETEGVFWPKAQIAGICAVRRMGEKREAGDRKGPLNPAPARKRKIHDHELQELARNRPRLSAAYAQIEGVVPSAGKIVAAAHTPLRVCMDNGTGKRIYRWNIEVNRGR